MKAGCKLALLSVSKEAAPPPSPVSLFTFIFVDRSKKIPILKLGWLGPYPIISSEFMEIVVLSLLRLVLYEQLNEYYVLFFLYASIHPSPNFKNTYFSIFSIYMLYTSLKYLYSCTIYTPTYKYFIWLCLLFSRNADFYVCKKLWW